MHRVIFPFVACLPLPYPSHYFKYVTVSDKKLNIECAFSLFQSFLEILFLL